MTYQRSDADDGRTEAVADVLTIREAQWLLDWNTPYGQAFADASSRFPHLRMTHAVLHAAKSIGRISAILEKFDHSDPVFDAQLYSTMESECASLMAVAMRLSQLIGFDLATAYVRADEVKNNVQHHAVLKEDCKAKKVIKRFLPKGK